MASPKETGGFGANTAPAVKPAPKQARSKPTQTIPPVVANRMARRVAICAATPTAFGMASFLVSYWLVSRQIIDVPPALTLLVSGSFFLLGLLGLSYGLFSSSWLEAPGSFFGFEQIGVNVQRLRNGAVARRSEQP